MPEVITDNLDLWTSALLTKSTAGRGSNGKLEAYGIKKLRELILDLAVSGKLVPQDASDEPASELLKRIAVEKARLITEGSIKEGKPLPVISEEEKTYQLPQSWEWSRMADLTSVLNGRAYSKQELLDSGTPVLRVGNLFTSNDWYYSNLELEEDKYCDAGDLIFAWSASFGPFIWAGPKVIYHYHIWKLNLHSEADLNKNYLYKFLLEKTQEMKASGHGVSMIHMTKEAMERMVVPVPPLAEQHRIVAKVEELMALCDQLEQQQNDSLAAHQTLVETLLGTLLSVESQQEFSAAWARIASNFDTLFTTEASIDQLKQTILQLAVMGKLIPQDPGDEPASELFKRIQTEKAKLIAEGKIKKDKPLPQISEEEKPYTLPPSWEWVRLPEIYFSISPSGNKLLSSAIKDTGTFPVVDQGQRYIAGYTDDAALLINLPGPVVVFGDHTTERKYIDFDFVAGADGVKILRPILQDEHFFFRQLQSYSLEERGYARHFKVLNDNLYALPPIEEQHRIVAKVDEIMALCDALKANLAEAQTTQLYFADAIVERAIS